MCVYVCVCVSIYLCHVFVCSHACGKYLGKREDCAWDSGAEVIYEQLCTAQYECWDLNLGLYKSNRHSLPPAYFSRPISDNSKTCSSLFLSISIFYDLLPHLCKTKGVQPAIPQYKKGSYPRESSPGFSHLFTVQATKAMLATTWRFMVSKKGFTCNFS